MHEGLLEVTEWRADLAMEIELHRGGDFGTGVLSSKSELAR